MLLCPGPVDKVVSAHIQVYDYMCVRLPMIEQEVNKLRIVPGLPIAKRGWEF